MRLHLRKKNCAQVKIRKRNGEATQPDHSHSGVKQEELLHQEVPASSAHLPCLPPSLNTFRTIPPFSPSPRPHRLQECVAVCRFINRRLPVVSYAHYIFYFSLILEHCQELKILSPTSTHIQINEYPYPTPLVMSTTRRIPEMKHNTAVVFAEFCRGFITRKSCTAQERHASVFIIVCISIFLL